MTLTSSKSTHSMTFNQIVQVNDFIRFFSRIRCTEDGY